MRNIDEYNITQAVIAHHAAAGDARLREVMTSLVQHLHAFAREVRLTEAEWLHGLRFVTDCGTARSDQQQELRLLSDTLGLSMLVTAQSHRKPKGCTDSTVSGSFHAHGAPHPATIDGAALDERCLPFHVSGRVRALDGTPIAGAVVRVWRSDAEILLNPEDAQPALRHACATLTSNAEGRFRFSTTVAQPHPVPHDGPVGRLLQSLGRHAWRPAHLHFSINADGYEPLVTQVFRADDGFLDSDAVFAVRSSLLADWVHHAPGRAPDGHTSAVPFYTLDFAFVLSTTTGDKP